MLTGANDFPSEKDVRARIVEVGRSELGRLGSYLMIHGLDPTIHLYSRGAQPPWDPHRRRPHIASRFSHLECLCVANAACSHSVGFPFAL
jgi:hypothetical protein